jgi:hypothetical protein
VSQGLEVVVVVVVVGVAGTRMVRQVLEAAWNFGFVWMLVGKIGPLPEKFGFGRL